MKIRFIYAYQNVLTGRDVYVGSAFDISLRDRQHTSAADVRSPFDRLLQECGRAAFSLRTLETVHGNTDEEVWRSCVERENWWMDKLGTFSTPHGMNRQRAGEFKLGRERLSIAHTLAWARPNIRIKRVEANRRLALRPDFIENTSRAAKASWADPKAKRLRIERNMRTMASNVRLTPESVRLMRVDFQNGMGYREISLKYKASKGAVKHAITGYSWGHVS